MPRKHQSLFFLHIPKTAGTSVRKMLEARVGLRNTLLILSADELRSALPDLKQTELVSGHLWFELRERLNEKCFVLTFLRDPLERAISTFYYYKTLTVEERERHLGKHQDGLWTSLLEDDLGSFIRKHHDFAKRELGERQTLDLARSTQVESCAVLSDFDFVIDDEQLERAKTNLDACNFVGIVENFDDSMALLAYELGWELDPGILAVNKSIRPKLRELDEETKALLSQICARDLELYEYGKHLFKKRWQAALTALLEAHRQSLFTNGAGVGAGASAQSIDFTFDQGVAHRYGFHEPERAGEGYVAWTGPEDRAQLTFDIDTTIPLQILVKVAATYDVETFESLKFFVDGKSVDSVMREVLTHELNIPANFCIQPERLTLEIQSKLVCPAELDSKNSDRRMVGAAVERISIHPTNGSVSESAGKRISAGFFGLLGSKARSKTRN